MSQELIPSLFEEWRQSHYIHKRKFENNELSYIDGLLPEIAVQLNVFDIIEILRNKFGVEYLKEIFNPNSSIKSPVSERRNGDWIKESNIVGVNVRTVGNFFNVLKYALTLPSFHDSIHLLPIWEPGVVASLYGKTSFVINKEFFSEEWAKVVPELNNAEKQLKALINCLHALGKTVGMDVIPHTDRFAEMVFTHPRNFEWVKRVGGRIISYSDNLYREIEEIIWLFLHRRGTANHTPISYSRNVFFNSEIPILTDAQRTEILFGYASDYDSRLYRRLDLMNELIAQGFETLPMTMAPPYRGLHIDADSYVMDENGNKWYDYVFDNPEPMSRVFGPLTRYKFYENKPDSWALNFNEPRLSAWQFISNQYQLMQQKFGFDFMRGDMAHVQPRPEGVPAEKLSFYDPLQYIKTYVAKNNAPYFAFYAETFLAPPDTMGYGDETEHLEKIEAEATLGDLQSSVVDSDEYLNKLLTYIELASSKQFAPTLTINTADKDDPRFDEFYQFGNVLRYFLGIFYNGMPSYYSLGFEVRNQNLTRNKNETYSKLYVFNIKDDSEVDKVTQGPFIWGKNEAQFFEILKIRRIAEQILPLISDTKPYVLKLPTPENKLMIWTQYPSLGYIFVVNFEKEKEINENLLSQSIANYSSKLLYSVNQNGCHECRIYEIEK